MIHSRGGTSFTSENADVVQWKSYPTGETQIKAQYVWSGLLEGHKTNSIATILLFFLIKLIGLQPVCAVEMVGWIKGGH